MKSEGSKRFLDRKYFLFYGPVFSRLAKIPIERFFVSWLIIVCCKEVRIELLRWEHVHTKLTYVGGELNFIDVLLSLELIISASISPEFQKRFQSKLESKELVERTD